jgi:hypothetical protein
MIERSRLLEKEMDELGGFLRLMLQLWIGWYTFFITANLVAIGMIFSASHRLGTFLQPIALLFAFVNCLAVAATSVVGVYGVKGIRRTGQIMFALDSAVDPGGASTKVPGFNASVALTPGPAVSGTLLVLVALLVSFSLFGLLAFWSWVLVTI